MTSVLVLVVLVMVMGMWSISLVVHGLTTTSASTTSRNNLGSSTFLSTSSLFSTLTSTTSNKHLSKIRFRKGQKSDESVISRTLLQNLMNFLGVQHERFVVAVNDDDEVVGWAQIRPLGPSTFNPEVFDAPPGTGKFTEKEATNEEIWLDFEADAMEFPSGFASLPWTREYREYSRRAAQRRERFAETSAPNDDADAMLWELASVYVSPKYRGRGIGSSLVRKTMRRHQTAVTLVDSQGFMKQRSLSNIYLLTLAGSTQKWYEALGFRVTDRPPQCMQLEIMAGTILSKLAMGVQSKLVCMKYENEL